MFTSRPLQSLMRDTGKLCLHWFMYIKSEVNKIHYPSSSFPEFAHQVSSLYDSWYTAPEKALTLSIGSHQPVVSHPWLLHVMNNGSAPNFPHSSSSCKMAFRRRYKPADYKPCVMSFTGRSLVHCTFQSIH